MGEQFQSVGLLLHPSENLGIRRNALDSVCVQETVGQRPMALGLLTRSVCEGELGKTYSGFYWSGFWLSISTKSHWVSALRLIGPTRFLSLGGALAQKSLPNLLDI